MSDQYFDRSRRPRTASATARVRQPQAPPQQQFDQQYNPYETSNQYYVPESAQSGFNAYSVPMNPPMNSLATNNPYPQRQASQPASYGSQISSPSASYNPYQQQQPQPGSMYSGQTISHRRHNTVDSGPDNYSQSTSIRTPKVPQASRSDSQAELMEMKSYQESRAGVDEEDEDEDGEYLDEIYQIIDAIVPRTDDPSIPASTFRVWFLGLIFGTFLTVINTIFSFRTNPLSITPFVMVLLAYPCGKFLEKVLPTGLLNPGPFNYKEHALIYVITSAMAVSPYAINNIVGQKYQLKQDVPLWACIVFSIVTQCFGYGFAGLTRRFLVRPAAMLWPSNFATIAMLNSLHINQDTSMGRYPMSRLVFFWLATSAMFFYSILPQYVAPMLGALSVICWFINNNVALGLNADGVQVGRTKLNKLLMVLGSSSPGAGVGFLSFSLDWTIFNATFAPITTPLWAMYNQMFGTYIVLWVVIPICWWFNVFGIDQHLGEDTPYGFTLNSPSIYNLNGSKLMGIQLVKQNVTPAVRDDEFYQANKPIHISTQFALTYTMSFAVFVSAMVHVGLWYGKDIWTRFRSVVRDLDRGDIHAQLMDVYDDVPDWWYWAVLVVTGAAGISVCIIPNGFDLPWWGAIIAIILALVTMLPLGIIQAISGQQIGLNVMSEFLIGLLLPGRIVAVMAFKTWCYMAMSQGLLLVQDLKLGHYIKIPPRDMFLAQLLPTLLSAIISTLSACFFYENFITGLKPNDETWNLSGYNTFFSAGAIWGAIGPADFFGPNSPYFSTLLGFVVGLVLPVIPWIMHKLQPDSIWHLINIPLIMIVPNQISSQQSTLITPLIIAIVVNFYIKKYRHTWWKKYAYVMSAAFDAGVSLCALFIMLLSRGDSKNLMPFPNWFLNPVDIERCLPDKVLECQAHANTGTGFGYNYTANYFPAESDFCHAVNS
ncbi:hypothetical protein HDU79_009367 [Rhizoclosmatium sp. JEL0117]|nr:hypothetical protein HDU79_009367 [Rhizoclosmatium sp. JEL0117]